MVPDIDKTLNELLFPWDRSDAPGVVVGVACNGKLLYRRAFGLASIEHGVVNMPTTKMRIGSTTKHFTCLAILLLAEEGKLRLDDPLRAYLPELANRNGDLTLLQLMHHTSGLRDPLTLAFFANHGRYEMVPAGTTLEFVRRFDGRNCEPGTHTIYSNSGYTLLATIVERVSGVSFDEFVRERMCRPLGMNNTGLLTSDMQIVPNMASMHLPVANGQWRRGIYPQEELTGAGGIVSTLDDMLLWCAHLRGNEKRFGGSGTWRRLLEKSRLVNGTVGDYCLGLFRHDYRGVEVVHHAGATVGSQCQMLLVPALGLDIVLLANRMDFNATPMGFKVLDALVGDEMAPPVSRPKADENPELQGYWYAHKSRILVEIKRQQPVSEPADELMLLVQTGAVGVIESEGGRYLANRAVTDRVEFVPPPDGKQAATMTISVAGQAELYERLPGSSSAPGNLSASLVGAYRSVDYGVRVDIVEKDGTLFIDLLAAYGISHWELKALSDEVLLCTHLKVEPALLPEVAVIFLDWEGDRVIGFRLDSDRARGHRFERCPSSH